LPSPSKSEKVPTPKAVRAIVCGLPAALSEMLIEPTRGPGAIGVAAMTIVQAAPAARFPPVAPVGQVDVLESAKSPAFELVSAMLVMLSVAVPVLFSVTV
jgi:hypothetical protein